MERLFDFKIIDSHSHPGYEKKGIEDKPGCVSCWTGIPADNDLLKDLGRPMAMALGFPDPGEMTKADHIPDFKVEHWVEFMEDVGISNMGLQAMDCESDPPLKFRWQVPYEYVKEDFIDKYPGRFWGIGGIHYKAGIKESIRQVEKAKELGFLGVKMFTPYEGYPNDPEKCYPVYQRCLELGLHVEIHTGDEGMPGARFRYCDPIFIDDIARDFPDLKIVQLHCGMVLGPEKAIWNCKFHRNVYADISGFLSRHKPKYTHYADLLRVMEEQIPDKVWWGSDYPVWVIYYRETMRVIRDLPLTAQFKRKLMRGNAEKFYLER